MHEKRRPTYSELLLEELLRALCHQHQLLHQLLERTDQLMALTQKEIELLASLDAETTRLANVLAALDQDDPEFNAKLDEVVERLRAVAHNPAQPIPPA